jgi:CubicO group peptidase (beta-lactamase class C family)
MNRKRLAPGMAVCLGIMLLVITGFSTQAEYTPAETKQMAPYEEELDAFIDTRMRDFNIPGLAAAVVRNGEVEYLKAHGTANPNGDLVTKETPFLLASVSKSFTAVGMMQLIEAGNIELDAPVKEYLPWFTVAGGDEDEVTVAHLLSHTSGFSERDGREMNLRPDRPDGLAAGVRDLSRVKLKFRPGEDWEYSNINYNVLGLLIQEVSGQRYEDYIQENVFERLAMVDSHTSLSNAQAENSAVGYYPFWGVQRVVDTEVPAAVLPAAGLWSSAADISRYLIAQLGDGSMLGLSSRGLAQLHTPGAEIEPGYNYAMGWFHSPNLLDLEFLQTLNTDLDPADDLQVLWHEGDWEGFKSIALLMPGQDFGVILLMNKNYPTITSVFRSLAWDVTLIANGGDAFYFQPSESFIVRYSRWLFSGLTLLLLAGLFWSTGRLRRNRSVRYAWADGLSLLLNLGLLSYLYFQLLPENNVNIRILLDSTFDLGLLTILITMFSLLWILVSIANLVKARSTLPG